VDFRRRLLRLSVAAAVVIGMTLGCSSANRSPAPPAAKPSASPPTSIGGPTPTSGGGPAPTSSDGPGRRPARPQGVIALYQYGQCANPGACGLLHPKAADNPAVAGLMIRLKWKDVQTGPGASDFNWEMTDNVFRQAGASKFVVLSLVPGIETPQWALDRVPSGSKRNFCIPYGLKSDVGKQIMVPYPWDDTYLNLWYDFLKAVAERYAGNPEFLMIAASGPTSISEEMSLPGAQGSSKVCPTQPALQEWMNAGYTPAKFERAWREVFRRYAALFPNQYVSLALYRGVPIGVKNGSPVVDDTEAQETPRRIIAAGMSELPGKFVVEANGLDANSPKNHTYQLVKETSGKTVTGFEFATAATVHPDVEGDDDNPVRALCLAMSAGVAARVDFIEIYEEDASRDDPAVQNVLQAAAKELLVPSGERDRSPTIPPLGAC
jgi:hypothetical protein